MNNLLKKIMFIILFAFTIFTFTPVNATETSKTKIELSNGDGFLTYVTGEEVLVNEEFDCKDTEFRAVWVTPKNNGINRFESEAQYKQQILEIFDVMEYYNMNVLIFHIRIMNDAFYESKYNNWSSYYSTDPSWEALPWIIEECHKRGIEFHAWMNPYRVTEDTRSSFEEISEGFPENNPASNPENLLRGSYSVIMDPGIPEVRQFLVDTCMEVIENYDVDAIHFDDYFYDNAVDDERTREKYNTENLSLDDFRRKQVNDFIQQLSNSIRKYNEENNENIQLGISPSGVYRSGDGKVYYDEEGNASSNGSNTFTSYQHYGNYHYADTVKWINEEWIDYILPQTYWALEHGLCPYADLMQWWDAIVKYKNVSLYSGMALYQIDNQTSGASWATNDKEGYNEIMVCNTLENVSGVAIYDYSYLKNSITDTRGFIGVKEIWNRHIILPEIKYAEKVKLDDVTNLKAQANPNGNILTWDDNEEAKFYVIYRSESELTFGASEVIEVIGHVLEDGVVTFVDATAEKGKEYNYGVRVQSNTNTLSDGVSTVVDLNETDKVISLGDFENFAITNNALTSSKVLVEWDELLYPLGSKIKYILNYSFDNGEVNALEDFNYSNLKYSCNIDVPNGSSTLKIVLKAANDIGSTIKEELVFFAKYLGDIKDLKYEGSENINEKGNFSFLGYESNIEIEYYLQYSTDLISWENLNVVTSKKAELLNIEIILPINLGISYYRIYAVDSEGSVGFSDILSLTLKEKLDDFKNIKINEEIVGKIYFIESNNNLVTTFDSFNSIYGVDYNVYYSTDYSNWNSITLYNKKTKITEDDEKVTITIPINESRFKIFLKIEAYNKDYIVESKVYEVFIEKSDLFFAEVFEYFNDDLTAFINKQGFLSQIK